jgi:FkbM family methyltransferase
MNAAPAPETPGITRDISAFLAAVALKKPQDEHAEKVYRWAVQLDPSNCEALNALGAIALARRDALSGYECFANALLSPACSPKQKPAFLTNCAVALLGTNRSWRFDRALALCDRAIEIDPSYMGAHIQKVSILIQLLKHEEALAAIAEGLKADPVNDVLHFMRGVIGLTQGADLDQAWADYDHRAERAQLAATLAEYPEWHGEPLEGKTLLVYGEQGIGDQIMFARYLPQLRDLGGKIVLYTHSDLARLLDGRMIREPDGTLVMPDVPREIITSDRELGATHIDCWIGSSSLARWCNPVVSAPYLRGRRYDDDRTRSLVPQDSSLKIGLCWAGSPRHPRDEYRSLAYSRMGPLLSISGVTPYALQRGPASEQNDGRCKDLGNEWRDLAEAAAILTHLDLVITVDTSIAHLAGALGIPVWVMLAQGEEWRWGIEGPTTPWYPSMRLFRQPSPGDWDSVIAEVEHQLRFAVELHALKAPRQPRTAAPVADAIVTKDCRYGRMSFYRSDRAIGASLDMYGEWSESEAELFRDLLKPGDVVVEAGANVGALTLALANIVGLGGKVHAFEPQPEILNLLHENVVRNTAVVTLYQYALGKSVDNVLLADFDVENPGGCSVEGLTDDHPTGRFACQTVVDAMNLPRLDFLKADVEGMESHVLEGAKDTIARCRPLIYVENDRPGAMEMLAPWLDQAGYRVYQHLAPLYNPQNFNGYRVNVFGNIVSSMLLAVPKERYGFTAIIEKHELKRVVVGRKELCFESSRNSSKSPPSWRCARTRTAGSS